MILKGANKGMIKILCAVVLCGALLASCGRNANVPMETNTPAAAETSVEATATTVSENKPTENSPNLIGEEKAKEIALQKAGLSHGEVVFDRVELEKDEGPWHYEVEFKKGRTEYNADINASDGTIMSWETDIDD